METGNQKKGKCDLETDFLKKSSTKGKLNKTLIGTSL